MQTLLSEFNKPGPGSMTLDAWLWAEVSDHTKFDEDIIVYHCIIRILEWWNNF